MILLSALSLVIYQKNARRSNQQQSSDYIQVCAGTSGFRQFVSQQGIHKAC